MSSADLKAFLQREIDSKNAAIANDQQLISNLNDAINGCTSQSANYSSAITSTNAGIASLQADIGYCNNLINSLGN